MSNAIRRCGLPALLLVLVGTVAAQPPGEVLKKSEDARKIEAQKLEIQFSDAIRQADSIGRSNPRQAVQVLQDATAAISADTEALTPERRAAMLRKLELDRKAWGDRADTRTITPGPSTGSTTRPETRQARDTKEVYDFVKDRVDKGNYNKTELAKIADDRGKANLAISNLIVKAGIPEYRDMTFPRDWVEKMSKRTSGVRMTEQEKAILKALGAQITVDYQDNKFTFKDVIDDLQRRTGQPFVVDQRALDEANVKYDTPVNLSLKGVTTRTVLKRILADLNLTYVVKDQAIQITTPARAKEMLTIRSYSVVDLMPMVDMRLPYALNQIQAYNTLQQLVVLITQTVEPDSWEVNGKGGLGTIVFNPVSFQLIVKQTAEVHYLMGLSGR
jgi:hypothetical protein